MNQLKLNIFLRKASIIILFIDAYTGQGVTGNVKVTAEKIAKSPVLKNNGFCIFTDVTQGDYDILFEGSQYLRKKIEIKKELPFWKDPRNYLIIFVYPNNNYKLQSNVTFITAKLEANLKVYSIPAPNSKDIILIDEKEGIVTSSFQPDKNITNRLLAFLLSPDNILKIYIVGEKKEGTVSDYKLKNWNNVEQFSNGTCLYPVAVGQTEHSGLLFMPLWNIKESDSTIYFYKKNSHKPYIPCRIIYGKGQDLSEQIK